MHKNKGFTLAELLIVIAVIGILSAMIVVNISDSRRKARDAKRIADLKSIQTAVELYANQHAGQFPTSILQMVPEYIQTEPKDPGINCSNGSSGTVNCEYLLKNTLCEGTTTPTYHYSLTARLELPNSSANYKACPTGGRSGKYYILEQ